MILTSRNYSIRVFFSRSLRLGTFHHCLFYFKIITVSLKTTTSPLECSLSDAVISSAALWENKVPFSTASHISQTTSWQSMSPSAVPLSTQFHRRYALSSSRIRRVRAVAGTRAGKEMQLHTVLKCGRTNRMPAH